MATSAELAALDGAHLTLQTSNTRRVLRSLAAYWLLVRADDIAGTGSTFLEQAIPVLLSGWLASARIGLAQSQIIRRVQVPGAAPFVVPDLTPPDTERLRTSLTYTGLRQAAIDLAKTPRDVEIKPRTGDTADLQRAVARAAQQTISTNQGLDVRRGRIMENAGANMLAAAIRHTQNGGRTAVVEAVKADPVARGWMRVTRGTACFFCAALASRGPVYDDDSFEESDPRFEGAGKYKVHDDCACTLRPVFKRGKDEWTEASLGYENLWASSTGGVSGSKKMLKFRQAYEGRSTS